MRLRGNDSIRSAIRGAMTAGLLAFVAATLPPPAVAQMGPGGIPQIPAFLPDRYSVPETEPLPIDGLWLVSTIGKKIRIERGRGYAVDPWLHLFVLKVEPDMVVLRNFRRAGAGVYVAEDLPLLGPATFRLSQDGNLRATVQGALGTVSYNLVKREPAYPQALAREITAMKGDPNAPPPSLGGEPQPDPSEGPEIENPLASCKNLGVDPNTGDVVCKD